MKRAYRFKTTTTITVSVCYAKIQDQTDNRIYFQTDEEFDIIYDA